MGVIAKALLGDLDLTPDNDISNAAASFTDVVKGYVRTIQDSASMAGQEQEDEILAALYQEFFDYSMQWAAAERQKSAKIQNHAEAARLKQQASAALKDLQKNITRIVLCYAHLGRCMGVVHDTIVKTAKPVEKDKKFKWTSDTGTVLRHYQKERNALQDSNEKLTAAVTILEKAEAHLSALMDNLEKIASRKDAEQAATSLRSNLRINKFDVARKKLTGLGVDQKKSLFGKKPDAATLTAIQKDGKAFIDLLEASQEELKTADGKMFLSAREASVVLSAQEREIEQKTKYIDKYHLPYMENKLKSLENLRDKLLIFGSLEGLTTLYMRLVRGMAEPMTDIKQVRSYEAEVIENVNYILGGQFQEIGNTEKWTTQTMNEFYECMADFD
mgnify:CR=1 FL=1